MLDTQTHKKQQSWTATHVFWLTVNHSVKPAEYNIDI